jgi:hypothetical protein
MSRPKSAPTSKYVFARATTQVREAGNKYPTLVQEGTVWWPDCAIVKAHPDLFSADPPVVNPRGWVPAVVEQATAAPGETRDSGRANLD